MKPIHKCTYQEYKTKRNNYSMKEHKAWIITTIKSMQNLSYSNCKKASLNWVKMFERYRQEGNEIK